MKYTQLGKSGVKVSRLCLGTMNFGTRTDEKECFSIMDRALELNINFFDTANRYGNPGGTGVTETIIGKWLAQGNRRDKIFLATKFNGPMGPGANDSNLSAYHMQKACNESLKRLQTDRIDLYIMHHIDRGYPGKVSKLEFVNGNREWIQFPSHLKPGTGWTEIWQSYEQLIMSGKILYAGSSNFAAWNIAQANEKAANRHFLGLISEQSFYNLLNRQVELEVIPACRNYGVGFTAYSPLAHGALAGKTHSSESGRRSVLNLNEFKIKQIKEFETLCSKLGESIPTVALAWLLHNPVVTATVIGPRTVEQLNTAVRAVEINLDAETITEIDRIFPGPGGEAPEAYAW